LTKNVGLTSAKAGNKRKRIADFEKNTALAKKNIFYSLDSTKNLIDPNTVM
jgi:hypothetical protein